MDEEKDNNHQRIPNIDFLVGLYFDEIVRFMERTLSRSTLFYNFLVINLWFMLIVLPLIMLSLFIQMEIEENEREAIYQSINRKKEDYDQ